MATSVAPQVHKLWPGEVRNLACSFVGKLTGSELLASVTSITPNSTQIVIASTAVNTTAMTIVGATVSASQAVQCRVTTTDGTGGNEYDLIVITVTNSTPAQTLYGKLRLEMENT